MIAQIRGTVLDVRLNMITVDVSGIGYQLIVTPELASSVKMGQTISLFTSLVVREDSWSLFGFDSLDGKSLFEELRSVTGIGPKVANALLAVYQPGDLRDVISAQDNAALERVPGIGKKVASRILLELKDKYSGVTKHKTSLTGSWRSQIIGALTGLGYSNKEAELALENALQGLGHSPSEKDLPEILKLALAQSGRSK